VDPFIIKLVNPFNFSMNNAVGTQKLKARCGVYH